jgi:exonuclease SbcD
VHVFADDQHPPVPWVFGAGDERVAVVAVPFLDPYGVPAPRPADDGSARARTHEHVLADALEAGRALLDPADPLPTICVAHAYVTGAEESDSERALSVGGADRVDPARFAGFDYVALGHLHRPQRIGGLDTVAYSGSPLPYSFSESHPKSVRLLELDRRGVTDVRTVAVPVGRPVTTLTGTLDELLTDASLDRWLDHWIAARLTDETVRTQPMERLRGRFPHAVNLRYVPVGDVPAAARGVDGATLEERPHEDVVVEFLTEVRGREPAPSERALVHDALAAALGTVDR